MSLKSERPLLERLWLTYRGYAREQGKPDPLGPCIEIDRDGTRVAVGFDDRWVGGIGFVGSARYEAGIGPRFRIHDQGVISGTAETLGLDFWDEDLGGDEEFDTLMVVRTRELDETAAAWTDEARKAARSFAQRRVFASDGERIEVRVSENLPELLPEVLDRIAGVLTELARYRRHDLETLRALAGARRCELPDGKGPPLPGIELDRSRGVVRVGTRRGLGAGSLAAWIDLPAGMTARSCSVPLVDRSAVVAAVDREVELLNGALDDAKLVCDGASYRIVWSRWPVSEAVLAAADVLDGLIDATSRRGAYR